MNPWYSDLEEEGLHNSWENVQDSDWSMLEELGKKQAGSEVCSWFLMWVPLRKKTHKLNDFGQEMGAIVERFPGDPDSVELEFFNGHELEQSLAFLLPLLKNLNSIEHLGNAQFPTFNARIDCHSDVRLDHQKPQVKISGQVTGVKTSDYLIKFNGFQTCPSASEPTGIIFEQLRALDSWPKSFRLNDKRQFEQVRDKSRAEASVVLQVIEGQAGRLSLDWAVFLPIEEGESSYALPIEGTSRHFRFVLHGQFFVDAGRRGINGYSKLTESITDPIDGIDEAGLAIRWNQSIAQRLVLPNVLTVMADFVNQARLTDREITDLTNALQHARSKSEQLFYKKYQEYICQKSSWACVMSPQGRKWELFQTSNIQRILPLPKAPNDEPNRPWKILPGLNSLKDAIFYDESKPKLTNIKSTWDEQSLKCALRMQTEAELKRAFTTQSGLDYLSSFLGIEERGYVTVSTIQDELFNLIRRVFRLFPLSELRKNSARFKSVLRFLDRKRIVSIGTVDFLANNAVPVDVFEALFRVDSSILLVPRDLAPNNIDAAQTLPSDNDFSDWLRCIDQLVRNTPDDMGREQFLGTADYLLDLCSNESHKVSILLANKSLFVVKVQCPRSLKIMASSIKQLFDLNERGNLFLYSGNLQEKLGLTPLLARALTSEQLRVIDARTGRILREARASRIYSSSSPNDILKSLGSQPTPKALSLEDARLALIIKALEGMNDVDSIRAIRYLLHGVAEHFQNMDEPLWIEPGNINSPWIKTWKMIEGVKWNVLPSNLANAIPPVKCEKIGLRSVEPEDLMLRLSQLDDLSVIKPLEFSAEERDSILGTITDVRVWRAIPLHRFINGQFGSVSHTSFLQSERKVPEELEDCCQLIKKSEYINHANKQAQFLRKFDALTIIEVALEQPKPVNLWKLILKELAQVNENYLHSSLFEKVKATAWIPLFNGSSIKPGAVINVPELGDTIDRLATKAGYCYCGLRSLDENFRNHPGFSSITRMFSGGKEAAKQLGLLLAKVSDFHIGSIRPFNAEELTEMMPYLLELKLPGWEVLRRCRESFGDETVWSELLPNIIHPIPITSVSSALKALIMNSSGSDAYIETFRRYLELYHSYPRNDAIDEIKTLSLYTKAGSWRSSLELCDGSIGVDSSYVIDNSFSNILRDLVSRVGRHDEEYIAPIQENPEFENIVSASSRVLKDYFAPWEPLVRPEIVGAFMALFGRQLREQAEKWLQPHTADWLYNNLGWQVPHLRNDGTKEWMYGLNASDAFTRLNVGVRIIDGEEVNVSNLFGDLIKVPLASTVENLVAGGFYWKGGYSVEVRIRQIPDLSTRSSSELTEILKKSAIYILQHAYSQRNADIGAIWRKLQESDQLDLSVARSLILDHLPFVLRDQIGAQKRNHDLAEILKAYDKARRAKTEAEQTTNNINAKQVNHEIAVKRSLNALSDLLVTREDVQAAVLLAVRNKLHDFQYDISGILFELFQNADDAVVELEKLNRDLHGESLSYSEERPFVVDVSNDAIRAIHWGRPINYCPPDIDDGRADDFRRDLEKMLILSSSDKNQKSGVTGKFGLGFKSVLLATETPKVLSGDLRFEIVGGVLPQPWQTSSDSVSILVKHSVGSRLKGTMTELPISDIDTRNQILQRFSSLCGIQSVFGRKIREIKITGPDIPVPRGRWKAKTQIGNFEIGSCDMPTANGWSETNLLVFRSELGCVALRLGLRGFEKIDRHTPPFWVTAPTRESEPIGFLVNGGFEVDAGRSRLASKSKSNQALSKDIGVQFGRELSNLFRCCEENWESIRQQMDLAGDVKLADYWASLWRAIYLKTESIEGEAHQLAHIIASEALKYLIRVYPKIPNGICGSLSRFVMLDSPLNVLSGSWRSEEVLKQLSDWTLLDKYYPQSQWIADDIASIANDIYQVELKRLTVKNLTGCIQDGRCDEKAAYCFQLVVPKLLENQQWFEYNEAYSAFSTLKFRTKAGSWSFASSLLSKATASADEQLIAEFAPADNLLASEYSEQAISFFTQCKNKQVISAHDIAKFVIKAEGDNTRCAALRYLANGQNARQVAYILRADTVGTWLENIDEYKKLLSDLSNEDWLEIVLRLRPESIAYQELFNKNGEFNAISGSEKLQLIANWWEAKGREHYKQRYEEKFWPANVSRDFGAEPIDRRAWMTLFGLGLTRRMGRVKDSQHRGFIESLDSRGWWDVFCNIKPHENDGSREWLKVLEQYGESQIDTEEFGLWMDNFARLYRIARWLETYVHVFRTIDQRAQNEFGALLQPGADHLFQGDDETDAPSVERSLNNGKYLVIRELLRKGLLTSLHAKRRAFIPSLSVRQFFVNIGFQEPQSSEEIYEILSEAIKDPTFGGDYDIPLRIVVYENLLATILLEKIA